ncbi:S41 family peptidase [Shivajiella indica]|uniref:S41 family peptidase n=1 Tax=Shivajiella indica TaxID=872115 RepID=A0ABW5B3Z4_9BACT
MNNKSSLRFLLLGVLMMILTIISSCNDLMLGEEPQNTPVENFEVLWNEFDRMYALFEVKNLDWNQIYLEYKPRVNDNMSSDELFDLVSEMLAELNDGHVWMVKPDPGFRRFDSGPVYPKGDFDLDLVRNKLSEEHIIGNSVEPDVIYGKFDGEIGYIYIENLGMNPGFYYDALKTIIPYMTNTKGLIFDARGIEGGYDRSSQEVAGFFTKESKLYMRTKFKNGPGHDNFGHPIEWRTTPNMDISYNKPVKVLTNRQTGSAGETFVLAMKTIEHVKVLGDSTYGAFSDNPKRELPNGWIYAISTGDFRDANGISYEGKGIPPHELIQNTIAEVQSGLDKVLEKAIEELKEN